MVGKILIVDDEKNIVDIIAYNLKKEGFETLEAYNGKTGLNLALSELPMLVLLDVMMPELDGFEVCSRIREQSQMPIIMLTARVDEVDKVLGLELGADDYITKPFGVKELIARVKANLRRQDLLDKLDKTDKNENELGTSEKHKILTFNDLSINLTLFEVIRAGNVIPLTNLEYNLLLYLASNKDSIFTREDLLKHVWGYEYLGDVRTVDVTIRRLRTKLEKNPNEPQYVLTKRSVGYHFTRKY
ncbi:MAG: response regulator transcription factor [Firmicutes bacterium]|nr:response regulator transcription factor [Bacillota bacterium]